MGYDLKPKNNEMEWGRYNISGWSRLNEILEEGGMDASVLPYFNDGDYLKKEVCVEIGNTIEAQLDNLKSDEREWLKDDVKWWKECSGCWVW